MGLRRRPEIYLTNGNGALNAFAAQATGYDYVVLSNELFANLYNNNSAGLRFILGHVHRPTARAPVRPGPVRRRPTDRPTPGTAMR